jgi:hypothetical protein
VAAVVEREVVVAVTEAVEVAAPTRAVAAAMQEAAGTLEVVATRAVVMEAVHTMGVMTKDSP